MSKDSKPAPAVVEIHWQDAWIGTDDITLKKARKLKPIKRTTIGYLLAENDDCVVLCTDTFPKNKNEFSAPMVIPNTWIIEMWEYK